MISVKVVTVIILKSFCEFNEIKRKNYQKILLKKFRIKGFRTIRLESDVSGTLVQNAFSLFLQFTGQISDRVFSHWPYQKTNFFNHKKVDNLVIENGGKLIFKDYGAETQSRLTLRANSIEIKDGGEMWILVKLQNVVESVSSMHKRLVKELFNYRNIRLTYKSRIKAGSNEFSIIKVRGTLAFSFEPTES